MLTYLIIYDIIMMIVFTRLRRPDGISGPTLMAAHGREKGSTFMPSRRITRTNRTLRRERASFRGSERKDRTPLEQLIELDDRLGPDVGAAEERKRLLELLTREEFAVYVDRLHLQFSLDGADTDNSRQAPDTIEGGTGDEYDYEWMNDDGASEPLWPYRPSGHSSWGQPHKPLMGAPAGYGY